MGLNNRPAGPEKVPGPFFVSNLNCFLYLFSALHVAWGLALPSRLKRDCPGNRVILAQNEAQVGPGVPVPCFP